MSGELTYRSYLRVDDLLALQQPVTHDAGGDSDIALSEHFFIICHQACELWLKQILADLGTVEEHFRRGEPGALDRAVDLLARATGLLRLLHEQVVTLERLPLADFAAFRPYLGSASGAQSHQSHHLEQVIGGEKTPGSLYPAFAAGVVQSGTTVEAVVTAGLPAGVAHRAVEALLDLGTAYWRWKVAHAGLVSKLLGDAGGTGGSSGLDYLLRRAVLPFAELRELRGRRHEQAAREFQSAVRLDEMLGGTRLAS